MASESNPSHAHAFLTNKNVRRNDDFKYAWFSVRAENRARFAVRLDESAKTNLPTEKVSITLSLEESWKVNILCKELNVLTTSEFWKRTLSVTSVILILCRYKRNKHSDCFRHSSGLDCSNLFFLIFFSVSLSQRVVKIRYAYCYLSVIICLHVS